MKLHGEYCGIGSKYGVIFHLIPTISFNRNYDYDKVGNRIETTKYHICLAGWLVFLWRIEFRPTPLLQQAT